MSDEAKKIIVDDDWKNEAKREKERLAQEESQEQAIPEASFGELINILVMQVMAALGAFPSPDGKPLPPQPEVAKHFIDLLQLLEEKTRNNLTAEEKELLDHVLYETRMAFVQLVGGRIPPGAAAPGPQGV